MKSALHCQNIKHLYPIPLAGQGCTCYVCGSLLEQLTVLRCRDIRPRAEDASFDKKTLKRIEDIQALDTDTQKVLFNIIDTYLRDAKARMAYQ